ncbi:hypothetical protein ES703_122344 [subsurface metagenome]
MSPVHTTRRPSDLMLTNDLIMASILLIGLQALALRTSGLFAGMLYFFKKPTRDCPAQNTHLSTPQANTHTWFESTPYSRSNMVLTSGDVVVISSAAEIARNSRCFNFISVAGSRNISSPQIDRILRAVAGAASSTCPYFVE